MIGLEFEKLLQLTGLKDFERFGGDLTEFQHAALLHQVSPNHYQRGHEDAIQAVPQSRSQAEGQLATALLVDQAEQLLGQNKDILLLQTISPEPFLRIAASATRVENPLPISTIRRGRSDRTRQ